MLDNQIKDGRTHKPFVQINKSFILDKRVSAETRLTVTVMECREIGWRFNVKEIRETCGYGSHVWRRVSREMVALGILFHERHAHGTMLVFAGVDNYEASQSEENPPVGFQHVGYPPVGNRPSETDALNNNHVINHDYHEGEAAVELKAVAVKHHDIIKKPKAVSLTGDEQAIYAMLLTFGWRDFHAMAAVRKHAPVVFYDLFEQMHKRNIKSKGAYIRGALRKFEKEVA